MASATPQTQIKRDWIAAEFSKGIGSEQSLANDARARAEAPPDPSLVVLYNEIAAADQRHRATVETIATRYGHTPTRGGGGGLSEAIGRIRDKVVEAGTTPLQRVGQDLIAKANSIHWATAWIQAFQSIGDAESARELSAVLTEEVAHRDALQEALNRMVLRGATTGEPTTAAG